MNVDEKYKNLINDQSLYPTSFIENFGRSDTHWCMSSNKERERSLAHDMVCVLLCNLEPVRGAEMGVLKSITKRRKKAKEDQEVCALLEGPSTSKQAEENKAKRQRLDSTAETFEEEDELMDNEEDDVESDESEEELVERYATGFFRYHVIEGLPNAAAFQNSLTRKWKIDNVNGIYDIADTLREILIEVKLSENPAMRIYEYSQKPGTGDHTALIVVNPQTGAIETVNINEDLPGVSKVVNFLMLRKSLMDSYQIDQTIADEYKDLTDFVFCSNYIKEHMKTFQEFYTEIIEVEGDDGKTFPDINLSSIGPQVLFDNLTKDHIMRDGPTITWNGKLLPPMWKVYKEAMEHDENSIDTFLSIIEDIGMTYKTGNKELYLMLTEFQEQWDTLENSGRNFAVWDCRTAKMKRSLPPNIMSMLGINRKARKNLETEGMKQRENAGIVPLKYDRWFDKLVEELSRPHPFGDFNCFRPVLEIKEMHKIYAEMVDGLSKFFNDVSKTNTALMMSEIENMNSRLCGAYLAGTNKNGNHNRIVCMPIISNFYSGQNYHRKMSGIILRGPTHARSLSDNTNIVTIEMVKKDFDVKLIKNHCLIETNSDFNILLRQNAVKKIDASYLTFIRNSLFGPSNLLGEMFNINVLASNRIDVPGFFRNKVYSPSNRQFFIDRVTDGVLMAAIGNSRDEGYFAMLRKILMIMLNSRRNSCSFSLNPVEFCSSANECLIDNPLSMYFHNSILYLCARYMRGGA